MENPGSSHAIEREGGEKDDEDSIDDQADDLDDLDNEEEEFMANTETDRHGNDADKPSTSWAGNERFEIGDERILKGLQNRAVDNLKDMRSGAGQWVDADQKCVAEINTSRRFVCIDCPATVKNMDKAIACFGGYNNIENILNDDRLRLDFRFRPEDPFCKPMNGSFTKTNNILIKVLKRPKSAGSTASATEGGGDGFEYKVEVIGVVEKVYSFKQSICDFQYLPVAIQPDETAKELLSAVKLNLTDTRNDFLSRDVPLFMPPLAFSRIMKSKYNLQPKVEGRKPTQLATLSDTDRQKRSYGTQNVYFSVTEVPLAPSTAAVENPLACSSRTGETMKVLKQMFQEQPIWSKVRLLANLNPKYHHMLQQSLPHIAYYWLTGPWRSLWCRLGYDPRKEVSAKKYQMIELRVPRNVRNSKGGNKRSTDFSKFSSHSRVRSKSPPSVMDGIDTLNGAPEFI